MNERLRFGGMAGEALRGAIDGPALLSGLVLVSTLLLSGRGLQLLGVESLIPLAVAALVSLVLAFHATADSAAGSTFAPRTIIVGLRCLAVMSTWLVPWMIWGVALGDANTFSEALGAPSPLALVLYVFGCMIATPVMLIACVRSRSWLDPFNPRHWSRELDDRGHDLLTIYTIQTGAAVLATLAMLPVVLLAARFNAVVGFAAIGLASCGVLGFWTALTGRLCGRLHALPAGLPGTVPSRPRFDEGLVIAGSELGATLAHQRNEAARQTQPIVEPQATAPTEAPWAEPAAGIQPPETADQLIVDPTPLARGHRETEKIERYEVPAKPIAFATPRRSRRSRRTPLLDAADRVDDAMKRFRLDPSHTLSRLAELNHNFAPNAHVLQALAICLHRTGHTEQAFSAAQQAFPLCFERGYVTLAAAMFYELRGELQRFDLRQEQVLNIAEALHHAGELAAAAKAFSLVIHADPEEIRAIKGLMDVAEQILDEKKKPAAAAKVYKFLVEHCTAPGLAEVMRDGLARCMEAQNDSLPAPSAEPILS